MILMISGKNVDATNRLLAEAKKLRVNIQSMDVKDLAERNFEVDINKYDCLFVRQAYPYFDEVLSLAKKFKNAGKRVVDSFLTGEAYVDFSKMGDLAILQKFGYKIPATDWFSKILDIKYPFILKWNYGFAGKNVFLIKNKKELDETLPLHANNEWLWQEFIAADYEYKVITVGFKSLSIILKLKFSEKSGRPDFSQFETVNKNQISNIASLAENAARILGKELSKIDILQKGDQLYILEANRWPGLKIFEDATGYNVAKNFLEYL